jgi:hypothetical protein
MGLRRNRVGPWRHAGSRGLLMMRAVLLVVLVTACSGADNAPGSEDSGQSPMAMAREAGQGASSGASQGGASPVDGVPTSAGGALTGGAPSRCVLVFGHLDFSKIGGACTNATDCASDEWCTQLCTHDTDCAGGARCLVDAPTGQGACRPPCMPVSPGALRSDDCPPAIARCAAVDTMGRLCTECTGQAYCW